MNEIDIIEYTNQAMLYELFTEPSFGKVSIYSNGSHNDMDHFTFVDSISVLNKYMVQFANLGLNDRPMEDLYEEAQIIGLKCEEEMLEKTNGVNTHKGLIFVLGILVCSSMKALYLGKSFEQLFKYASELAMPKMKELHTVENKSHLSNGEKIFLQHHIEGVRKEAALGFPIIQKALKHLDIRNRETHVKALIYIMSECDDTTIIHRNGLEGLLFVKNTMKDLIKEGYDSIKLETIQREFIKRRVSPGGSADLLCGTFFLNLIKNKFN